MRSTQRLREGRAKPSDVVAKDLHLADIFDMEAAEPYAVFAGLTLMEMRELREDIELWQVCALKLSENLATVRVPGSSLLADSWQGQCAASANGAQHRGSAMKLSSIADLSYSCSAQLQAASRSPSASAGRRRV